MSDNAQSIDINDNIEVVGPGKMLREARLGLGLTEQQVAKQMNLRPTLIIQIEHDQFDANTPEIYVRGYLKHFAKIVQVDTQTVLSAYAALTIAKHQGTQMQSFSQTTRNKTEHNRLMIISYFIIFLLMALTVVWWMQESDKSTIEAIIGLDVIENTASTEQTTPSVELLNSQNDQINTSDSTSITNINEDEQATADLLPVVAESVEKSAVPSNAGNTALIVTKNDAVNAEEESNSSNLEPLSTFVFSFNGDCWVNIFDANGDRLAWGIKKSEYVMTLQGKAPFTITLGKPELVTIVYNQQPVDLSNYQSGQIAKFSWPKQ
ncbi:RodZ domain-containing protein [Colwelliaceae bacterium BS250]